MAWESEGVRQIRITLDPWASGHTSANVVVVDYRGSRRVEHRVGLVQLRVGRQDLVGLTSAEVTWRLIDELHKWLSVRRPTLPAAKRPGAPLGAMGGTVPPVPGQLSLDLDLTI